MNVPRNSNYAPYSNNPLPIVLRNQGEKSSSSSLGSTSMLPSLHRKSAYYLAHSVDLSHPVKYVNVKLQDKLIKDQIFYDNRKDSRKVQNRKPSPEELKESQSRILNTISVDRYEKRNMGYSKDMPFKLDYYNKAFEKSRLLLENNQLNTSSK